MATFRVGQRVRIVKSHRGFLQGREATIIGSLECGCSTYTNEIYWGFPLEVDGVGRIGISGFPIAVRPEWLEPIQPERNQMVEWSECAWQPPRLREVGATNEHA